jgi:hypothetical protein
VTRISQPPRVTPMSESSLTNIPAQVVRPTQTPTPIR